MRKSKLQATSEVQEIRSYNIPYLPITNNRHLNFHLLMKRTFAAPPTEQPDQPTHSKIQDNENN